MSSNNISTNDNTITDDGKMEQAKLELHDDFYVRVLKEYYFPFQLRFHKEILVAWFIIFIVCIVYGPTFLNLTKNSLDLPSSIASVKAINAFQEYFPNVGSAAPSILLQQSLTTNGIINADTKQFSANLATFVKQEPSILHVAGYWELINVTGEQILAEQAVSTNNRSMVSTVYFKKGVSQDTQNKVVNNLINFAIDQSNSQVYIACTGITALFDEMTASTKGSFLTTDATVIPIAIVILGVNLQSYRHMAIALLNLGCALLFAFGILVPIAGSFSINPFSPSIMMSLGVAICFDYSLFMLNRYREEIVVNKSGRAHGTLMCLAAAGHVVLLSGLILLFTFILLVTFPQAFLQSIGITCSVIVFTSLMANLTLTPALLLTFECFEHFEAYPTRESFCCWISKASKTRVDIIEHEHNNNDNGDNGEIELGTLASPTKTSMNNTSNKEVVVKLQPRAESYFFRVSFEVSKHPWLVLLCTGMVMVPFLWQVFLLEPTSDNNLVYLPGSRSYNAYHDLKQVFPPGSVDPYDLLVVTNNLTSVYSSNYFEYESNLITKLLANSPSAVDASSITALTFCNGQSISYAQSIQYTNKTSSLYNTNTAINYRALTNGLVNGDGNAALVKIETTVDPDSQKIVPFIVDTRDLIDSYSSSTMLSSGHANVYLFGGYTTTYDLQEVIYALVPVMISVTVAAVMILFGITFGSVALTLRLVLTVGISLCWTYGFLVIVYQPGPGQTGFAKLTPSILNSSGIYWLIPIMSFSILIGLALDYDIFLMSRMLEYRRLGWSDNAAICLGVEKTGLIITTAGLIMSISFAGLLIPKPMVLNQYGFSLFLGVAFDTFVVRTFLMPAVIAAFGYRTDVFWWPSVMPSVLLTVEEEKEALFLGYESPAEFQRLKSINTTPIDIAGSANEN